MLAAVSRFTTLGDQRKERIGNRKYAYNMNEGQDESIYRRSVICGSLEMRRNCCQRMWNSSDRGFAAQ